MLRRTTLVDPGVCIKPFLTCLLQGEPSSRPHARTHTTTNACPALTQQQKRVLFVLPNTIGLVLRERTLIPTRPARPRPPALLDHRTARARSGRAAGPAKRPKAGCAANWRATRPLCTRGGMCSWGWSAKKCQKCALRCTVPKAQGALPGPLARKLGY